jgi:hypothetical protein
MVWLNAIWLTADIAVSSLQAGGMGHGNHPTDRGVALHGTIDADLERFGSKTMQLSIREGPYVDNFGTASVIGDDADVRLTISEAQWAVLLSAWLSPNRKYVRLKVLLVPDGDGSEDCTIFAVQTYHLSISTDGV